MLFTLLRNPREYINTDGESQCAVTSTQSYDFYSDGERLMSETINHVPASNSSSPQSIAHTWSPCSQEAGEARHPEFEDSLTLSQKEKGEGYGEATQGFRRPVSLRTRLLLPALSGADNTL